MSRCGNGEQLEQLEAALGGRPQRHAVGALRSELNILGPAPLKIFFAVAPAVQIFFRFEIAVDYIAGHPGNQYPLTYFACQPRSRRHHIRERTPRGD